MDCVIGNCLSFWKDACNFLGFDPALPLWYKSLLKRRPEPWSGRSDLGPCCNPWFACVGRASVPQGTRGASRSIGTKLNSRETLCPLVCKGPACPPVSFGLHFPTRTKPTNTGMVTQKKRVRPGFHRRASLWLGVEEI